MSRQALTMEGVHDGEVLIVGHPSGVPMQDDGGGDGYVQ